VAENHDIFGKIDVSRRDFMKLIGAGSLAVGLGALGIPNILNNIKGALAQIATPINTTNLPEQVRQIQLMLPEQV
jgi:hypothetical protein